jgi:hypothetical protein
MLEEENVVGLVLRYEKTRYNKEIRHSTQEWNPQGKRKPGCPNCVEQM